MSKEVQAAVGTERQFAKQPELPYALRLNPLNVSSGISQSVDYDAQRLASALGAMPQAIGNLQVAIDKRQKENAQTILNADKILMGKSKEDLQKFNDMSELQHVQGYNLSHNKYAMAILDRAAGQMASTYAKQQWADMPESQKPKSVEEQVHLFQQLLEENRKSFGDGVKNQQAFDEGYYKEGISDTLKVANEADQRINDEKHYKMMMAANVGMENLIFSGVTGDEFVNSATPLVRQIELASRALPEFSKSMRSVLSILGDKDIDGSRLKAFENMKAFGDIPLSKLMSFAPYKQKIAVNCRKEIARQAYEKYKLPNGGFDWDAYQADKKNRPAEMFSKSIPEVEIPLGADASVSPEMQGVASKIGGVLFNMGLGEDMKLTGNNVDKLDVYIGSPNSEQTKQLMTALSPYFSDVNISDNGTGTHLTLQGYTGGLDNVENKEDLSYGAYDPDRDEYIDKYVMSMAKEEQRKHKDTVARNRANVASAALQASNMADALDIVNNSDLSHDVKRQIMNTLTSVADKRSKAARGLLSPLEAQITKYEDPMSAQSVYNDEGIMREYQEWLKSDKPYTEKEQNRYNAAARRLNYYYGLLKIVNGVDGNGNKVDMNKETYELPSAVAEHGGADGSWDERPESEQLEEIKVVAKDYLENRGQSREAVERAINKLAEKYGIDPAKAVGYAFSDFVD